MKVRFNARKLVLFQDVAIGQTFTRNERLFLKMSPFKWNGDNTYNSVDLSHSPGQPVHWNDTDQAYPIEGTFVEEE